MENNQNIFLKKVIVGVVIIVVLGFLAVRGQNSGSTSSNGAAFGGVGEVAMVESGGTMSATFDLAQRKSAPDSIGIFPPQPPGFQTGGGEEFYPVDRLIIKTANMSVVVEDVEKAVSSVVLFATENGGFEVERNIYKQGLGFAGVVTVRVPVKVFETSIAETKKLGELRSQQINGQDITEEFVDVQAQLKNLRTAEEQFQTIMLRATKIEDVLAVQRELTNVRSQIERLEGRKKYLEQSASLSTLSVNFFTDPDQLPVVDDQNKWKPISVIKEAARNLLNLGKGLVNGLIWVAVFIPVWLVVFILYRVAKKKLSNKE